MVHISQLSEARVERVEDVVRQGDEVTVRVREIDSRGSSKDNRRINTKGS